MGISGDSGGTLIALVKILIAAAADSLQNKKSG